MAWSIARLGARVASASVAFSAAVAVARVWPRGERRLDLGGTRGEMLPHVVGDALDLEHAVVCDGERIAKSAQLGCDLHMVDRACVLLEGVEVARVEAAPVASIVLGHVEDDVVGVEVRRGETGLGLARVT